MNQQSKQTDEIEKSPIWLPNHIVLEKPSESALTKVVKWFEQLFKGICSEANGKILLAIVVWYAGQIYTQQLDYWRKQNESLLQQYQDLLSIASEMIVEVYPPDDNLKSRDNKRISELSKRFETLYWGKSRLFVNDNVECSLKDLHTSVLNITEGFKTTNTEENDQINLQIKSDLIAEELRKDYEKNAKSWFWFFNFSHNSNISSKCVPNNSQN